MVEEGAFCLLDLTSRIAAATTTTTEEDRGESDDGIHLCQSKSQGRMHGALEYIGRKTNLNNRRKKTKTLVIYWVIYLHLRYVLGP